MLQTESCDLKYKIFSMRFSVEINNTIDDKKSGKIPVNAANCP